MLNLKNGNQANTTYSYQNVKMFRKFSILFSQFDEIII